MASNTPKKRLTKTPAINSVPVKAQLKPTKQPKPDSIDLVRSDWFKKMSKKMTGGEIVQIYRQNFKLTQQQLAKKIGMQKATYISDIENDRKPVSKDLAKKFSAVFAVAPTIFFDYQ